MPNFFEGGGGAALTGVGQGLSQNIQALQQTARETREQPLLDAQTSIAQSKAVQEQALTQETLRKQQKVKLDDLRKDNPYTDQMLNMARLRNPMIGKDGTVTVGEIEDNAQFLQKNPEMLHQIITERKNQDEAKVAPYVQTNKQLNDDLAKLKENPNPDVDTVNKINKVQEKIAENQKAMEPIQNEINKHSQLQNQVEYLVNADKLSKMTPEDREIARAEWQRLGKFPSDSEFLKAKLEYKEGMKTRQPYMNPKGETVLINPTDPDSQEIIRRENLVPASVYSAKTRVEAFGSRPTNTPGVFYDGGRKKYFENVYGANGEIVNREITSAEAQQKNLDYTRDRKLVTTANSPQFRRIINNGEILVEGVKDPKTGARSEPELDKIIRLRNEIDDGVFGSINNKFRTFNNWDQFVKYQISDPKMAKFKSAVVANVERLGAMYAGGGSVTSDKKLEIAMELMDKGLSKEAFKGLIDMHKDSIENTVSRYRQDAGSSGEKKPSVKPTSDPLGIR